jgi:hypothetical protein
VNWLFSTQPQTRYDQYNRKRRTRNTNSREKLSTVDLLIKVACFLKKVNNIFNIKSN